MVSDQLEPDFVHELHPAAQRRVIRAGEAEVDHVQDVRGEEYVDEDVGVVDAGCSQDCVQHPPRQEHRRVKQLSSCPRANTQVDRSDLCLHFYRIEVLLVSFQQLVEKDWENQQEHE